MAFAVGLITTNLDLQNKNRKSLDEIKEVDHFSRFETVDSFLASSSKFTLLVMDAYPNNEFIGVDAYKKIKSTDPDLTIYTICNQIQDEDIFQILRIGSPGFSFIKDTSSYSDNIRILLHGGGIISPSIAKRISRFFQYNLYDDLLTSKEEEIVSLMQMNHSIKEITEILSIKENTLRSHIKNIYRKLKVNSRSQLIDKLNRLM